MSTPVNELDEPNYNAHGRGSASGDPKTAGTGHRRSSGEDTYFDGNSTGRRSSETPRLQKLNTNVSDGHYRRQHMSPASKNSRALSETQRLEDDLEMLKAERIASRVSEKSSMRRGNTAGSRSRENDGEQVDELGIEASPVLRKGGIWHPPTEPATKLAKVLKKIHESSVLVRYFTYIVPVVLALMIPLLLSALLFEKANIGGVRLLWFTVWLIVVWLSLWAGRILAKCIPYPVGWLAGALTNGAKKWRDMAKMLEVPATLFFWWLGIFVSFLPTMKHHHMNGDRSTQDWEKNTNIVLLSLFVGATLNFVEKIIIQLIAISFHQRTYADRIELNKFQISSLAKLYRFAKEREQRWEEKDRRQSEGLASGTITPKALLLQARGQAQGALNKIGDVVGKIAGDFTGRQVNSSSSPQQVVLTLLQNTEGSQVLARRLYRSFCESDSENVHAIDLKEAFINEEEAEAAFMMFDRDLNGDISCEEMELACVEIGRERKAITASLKDLDSVVGKFDDVLTFVVVVIVVLVFLSLISKSTAGVLTSASSSVLALSWLFSATAQEFLASLIFVFIKHPFDVGDRVDIYNTGGTGLIGTYMVKEISLMYTEFKQLTGEVVQAPNSLLNTVFILNMRRSGGLAEPIAITFKFGTTLDQIEALRECMLEFVKSEKREYQGKILTELRDIPNMFSVNCNIVFFYKSNWQNELVRMARRNKFMCALMVNIQDLGIESANMKWPGQRSDAPLYLRSVTADQVQQSVLDRDNPRVHHSEYQAYDSTSPADNPATGSGPTPGFHHRDNVSGASSFAGGAIHQAKKVDFSLGMRDAIASDESGDVYSDNNEQRSLPVFRLNRVMEEVEREAEEASRSSIARSTSRTGSNGGSRGIFHRKRASSNTSSVPSQPVSHHNRFFGSQGHDEEMGIPISPASARRGPHGPTMHGATGRASFDRDSVGTGRNSKT